MNNQGELITKERIGFEKVNIALGILYQEWYDHISKNLSATSDIISLFL